MAGLGNIYADEVLFLARVHPLKTGAQMSSEEVRRLHGAIVTSLTEATDLLAPLVAGARPPTEGRAGTGNAGPAAVGRTAVQGVRHPRQAHPGPRPQAATSAPSARRTDAPAAARYPCVMVAGCGGVRAAGRSLPSLAGFESLRGCSPAYPARCRYARRGVGPFPRYALGHWRTPMAPLRPSSSQNRDTPHPRRYPAPRSGGCWAREG